jgi:hypothetical protein
MLEKTGNDDPYDKGINWVIPKPPGWDELQKKLADYNPNASGARQLSLSALLSCSLLAVFSMVTFY